jgi:HSP20 family molecular chaperone IbpA
MLNNGCKVSEAVFKNGMLTIKIVDETKYAETKKIKIKN